MNLFAIKYSVFPISSNGKKKKFNLNATALWGKVRFLFGPYDKIENTAFL